MTLTVDRLRSLLLYDFETGVFHWRRHRGRVRAGQQAGSPHDDGYVQIKIDSVLYKAHRLAWFYVYGEWPTGRLDHRDNVQNNNRITNLRPASHAQNMANRRVNANSSTGVKGVSPRGGGRYRAYINVNGKRRYLGDFETIDVAKAVRESASKKFHGEFARTA